MLIVILCLGGGYLIGRYTSPQGTTGRGLHQKFGQLRYQKEIVLHSLRIDKILTLEQDDRYSNKLKLMLVVPVLVNARVDLTNLNYRIEKGNIIHVTIPEPTLDDPVFDLEKARNIDVYQGFGIAYSQANYTDVFAQLQKQLKAEKQEVLKEAVERGIRQDAGKTLRLFLQGYARALGADIIFDEPPASKGK